MARRPYRNALYDQPLECRLIPFTGDEVGDRTERLSAARPWLYFPYRNPEETSLETSQEDAQEDSVDFYQ
jgi:hypothetical protein